jgi:hypothetical protein
LFYDGIGDRARRDIEHEASELCLNLRSIRKAAEVFGYFSINKQTRFSLLAMYKGVNKGNGSTSP